MSLNQDDIVIRIAGDLADIQKSLRDLRRQTREAGEAAKRSQRDWQVLGAGLDGLKRQVVGLVGAYLSLRTIGTVIRTVVTQTREQTDAVAQLEARLKSTENVIGLTSDQLQRMAAAYRDVSTFSDEAVISAQSVLLTYTQIGQETFPRALQSALDFATAMRVDVARAAETVGRALGEPSRAANALREQGFTFTGQQLALIRSLEETGRVAEAQAIILEELELAYGGAAAAARDGFGGALEALRNVLGDLFEAPREATDDFREAIEQLTDTLNDPAVRRALASLAGFIAQVGGLAAEAAAAFVDLFAGLIPPKNEIERLGRQIRDLDKAIEGSFLARPIGLFGKSREELEKMRAELQRQLEMQERAGEAGQRAAERIRQINEEIARLANVQVGVPDVARIRELREEQERLEKLMRVGITPFAERNRLLRPPEEPEATVEIDARPALARLAAQLKAAGVLLNDELKRLRDQLDRDLAQNLVSFEDYYRRRGELETKAIDQQLEQQRTALRQLDEDIRILELRGEVVEDSENKRAELVAQITVLERQRSDVAQKAAYDQANAERELADQLQAVRERLAAVQGDTAGARTSALEREFRDLLARLAAEGDAEGQELVRRLINVEAARARLDELEAEYDRSLDRMAREERRIELAAQTGAITERDARRQIADLYRETAAEVEALIPLMAELSAVTGDPAAIERLEELRLEIESLRASAEQSSNEMAENIQRAGKDAFADWISGAKSASDAWDSFVDNIRRQAADLLADQVIQGLVSALSGLGGGGGFFKNFGKGFVGASEFHTGGIAGQGGTPRTIPALAFAGAPRFHSGGFPGLAPGEVPAILQTGEEVLSRRDPRNRLNGGGTTQNVNVSIQAQDVQSFSRASRGQISNQIATELLRARNRDS